MLSALQWSSEVVIAPFLISQALLDIGSKAEDGAAHSYPSCRSSRLWTFQGLPRDLWLSQFLTYSAVIALQSNLRTCSIHHTTSSLEKPPRPFTGSLRSLLQIAAPLTFIELSSNNVPTPLRRPNHQYRIRTLHGPPRHPGHIPSRKIYSTQALSVSDHAPY